MPPLYTWHCPKCEKKMDILRDWEGYRDPPNDEEGGDCKEDTESHEWKKEIQVPLVTKSPGWGGKGSW